MVGKEKNTQYKQDFQIHSWIGSSPAATSSTAPSPYQVDDNQLLSALKQQLTDSQDIHFTPNQFFIPGWTGEGLISKEALTLKNLLQLLCEDAKSKFSITHWTKVQRNSIFSEFHSFLLHPIMGKGVRPHQIERAKKELVDSAHLFSELNNEYSSHQEVLQNFVETFCFRSVTLYILKIRFMALFCHTLGLPLSKSSLFNPTSFFNKNFKTGSKSELYAKSLKANEYSWFLPSYSFQDAIDSVAQSFCRISTTELMKIFSTENATIQSRLINFQDSEYSHSLSHKSFGIFLNEMMIFLPKWYEGKEIKINVDQKVPKVLRTLYSGDHLTSLTLSHWLAQEQNMFEQWDQILCPEFLSDKYKNGTFFNHCHELQFLSFLLSYSKNHDLCPIQVISQTIKEKYSAGNRLQYGQLSLLESSLIQSDQEQKKTAANSAYDRIVLNLTEVPKNNPHHFLCQNILQSSSSLSTDGHLFVITSQRLFVPSQKERIKQIQENLQIIGSINLEQLKGKGEIGQYIYVFKRNNICQIPRQHTWDASSIHDRKESHISFRVTGELTIFHKFNKVLKGFQNFFLTKNVQKTQLYQKEIATGITIEFYQDAILDGKLLSSNSRDKNHITHPSFFKGLMNSSTNLDYFFDIESMDSSAQKEPNNHFLGLPFHKTTKPPFVLIINYSDPENIKLEITSEANYLAKREGYGNAFYTYLGLRPKIQLININLFKEYFETHIGQQAIQLCLNGKVSQLKSKIKALLVPRFLGEVKYIPSYVNKNELEVFNMDFNQLFKLAPNSLQEKWKIAHQCLMVYIKDYPWDCLGRLSYFKAQLQSVIHLYGKQVLPYQSLFNNQLVIDKVVALKTHPLLPQHPDIYLDVQATTTQELQLRLTKTHLEKLDEHKQNVLHLIAEDNGEEKIICKLYGKKVAIQFCHFLMKASLSMPIAEIVQMIQVPLSDDLENILNDFQQNQNIVESISQDLDKCISTAFQKNIIP